MRKLLLAIVGASAVLGSAAAETTADRWNLADIYPSVAAWNADAARLDAQIKELAACRGHMGDGATRFRQCLDLRADMTKRYYRMAAFSGEQVAEDTGNQASLELDQKADLLGNRLTEAAAFVDPEILHIGEERVAQLLAQEPALAIYRFPLDEILRQASHKLDEQSEALVANLLKSGGSDYPYELVKKAGVDLATPAPYQALVARMNSIMDEIEAILARQKK